MRKLFTIGCAKKSLERFIRLLQDAGVDLVIDVRLNNTSQLAGFAKRDDLRFLLTEGFGIAYVHAPELAPTQELLDDYAANKDWEAYAAGFSRLVAERRMPAIVLRRASGYESPCLLCSEDDAAQCHRRLLAEAVAQSPAELEIEHLR